ncbi:MAG: carboxynorspermidine decarboxylase, partial [Pseudotabrizicola sp.]|nr:carboxynorspermidine decarboxylase [Pseudotabrizicola sp.]
MIQTPFYLIDRTKLARNMAIMDELRHASGAKTLLALKCFATWGVFDQMREHMDGTTSSSLYELKLGRERFGKETHAYSVAWADHEIAEAVGYADKIIFNSIGQLERFDNRSASINRGLRLNPRFSTSGFDLADPARPFSRLGEWDANKIERVMDRISGFMIHYNCENDDFDLFDSQLSRIENEFGALLSRLKWVSLGGGIHFTGEGYPVAKLAARLKAFSDRFG